MIKPKLEGQVSPVLRAPVVKPVLQASLVKPAFHARAGSQPQPLITCWDVLACNKCPRGLANCRYCQADAIATAKFCNISAFSNKSVARPKLIAVKQEKGVVSPNYCVTLLNFRGEWQNLEKSELTECIREKLEVFGELSKLWLSKASEKRAFAKFADLDNAQQALKELGGDDSAEPFDIVPGLTLKQPTFSHEKKPVLTHGPKFRKVVVYIDELNMPKRPHVAPSSTDCEVWIDPLPDDSMLEDWLAAFGEAEKVFRIPNADDGQPSQRGYVRFKEHQEADACVKAGVGSWSESERALSWQTDGASSDHAYPDSIVSSLIGNRGQDINELRLSCGLISIAVVGMHPTSSSESRYLHVTAAGEQAAIAKLRPALEKKLAAIHEEISDRLSKDGPGLQLEDDSLSTSASLSMSKWSIVIHIDELKMPKRPNVEPVHRDREVWVHRTPPHDEVEEWNSIFGEVEDVFRIPCMQSDTPDESGYVRFKEHDGAKECVAAGLGIWSESERALSWQGEARWSKKMAHTYPESIVSWFLKKDREHLKEVKQSSGVFTLKICGESVMDSPISNRLHFVAEGGRKADREKLREELEAKLAEIHLHIRTWKRKKKKQERWQEHLRQRRVDTKDKDHMQQEENGNESEIPEHEPEEGACLSDSGNLVSKLPHPEQEHEHHESEGAQVPAPKVRWRPLPRSLPAPVLQPPVRVSPPAAPSISIKRARPSTAKWLQDDAKRARPSIARRLIEHTQDPE